jgi:hypothetical protein
MTFHFFLVGIVGGGVQLGPLGTAATNRPIMPAPGDYDDGEIGGMMIGRGNRSTQNKPVPVPLCPPQTPHACPDANSGRRGGKPANNLLSYGTAYVTFGLLSHADLDFFCSHRYLDQLAFQLLKQDSTS